MFQLGIDEKIYETPICLFTLPYLMFGYIGDHLLKVILFFETNPITELYALESPFRIVHQEDKHHLG